MKKYLLGFLYVFTLFGCTAQKSKFEIINCYIDKDSLFFCEGKFTNPPNFKLIGNLKDEQFFTKIKKGLQKFNINEPSGFIVIKPIFFGANAIEYPVKFKALLDSNDIKKSFVQLEYTDKEMEYFGITKSKPFEIDKANFRMPVDEVETDTITNASNVISISILENMYIVSYKKDKYSFNLGDTLKLKNTFLKIIESYKLSKKNTIFEIIANKSFKYENFMSVFDVISSKELSGYGFVKVKE